MREPGSNYWISLAPSLNSHSGPHSRLLKLGVSLNDWISLAPSLNSRSGPRSRNLKPGVSLSNWILLAPLLNNRSGPRSQSGRCRKVTRSYAALHFQPLANPDESSPVLPDESSIPNGNGSTCDNPMVHENSSPLLSSPTNNNVQCSESNQESVPTQPINTTTQTKPISNISAQTQPISNMTESGIPNYAGGSIPMYAHKKLLKDKLEHDPTPKEIFLKCYTKDGTCTGKKVEEAVEAFDKLLYQATELSASEESPNVDMSLLWMDAVGGPKKGTF